MPRFVNYAFNSRDGTSGRTMPERLSDIKNVQDFGADPTGANASQTTAAVQAAVDAATAEGGGTVYFPVGFYTLNGTITFNHNGNIGILFIGDSGTTLSCNINGFVFDRHNVNSGSPSYTGGNWVFEKLSIQNSNTGSSAGGVRIGSSLSAAFRDCGILGQVAITTEDSPGNSSQNVLFENCRFAGPNASPYTAKGLVIGGSGVLSGCDFVSTSTGLTAYGSGLAVYSCRAEGCNIGYQFGLDSAGTDQGASGFSLASSSGEGDVVCYDFAGTCTGFIISGCGIIGHGTENSGYPNGTAGDYGFRIGSSCSYGLFLNCSQNSIALTAGFSIATASSRANLVFKGCTSQAIGGGTPWVLPSNAYTALFQDCNVFPVWTYSQLPTGGNVVEGDMFNISDGTNGLAWGATATNTGTHTTHYLVRYNGTNWTVVGK